MLPPITRDTQVQSLVFAAFSAMINDAVRFQNRQRAQPALAFTAIEDHIDAGALERLEHSLIDLHIYLVLKPRDLHLERLGGEAATATKGFEPQLIDRPAALLPCTLRVFKAC